MFYLLAFVTAFVQFDINNGALSGVRSDEDVIEIPATVTKIVGKPFNGLSAKELKCATGSKILSAEEMFLEGSSFTSVSLSLVAPSERQFKDLPYLRNLIISESWDNIPSELCSGCVSLTSFNLHGWAILLNRSLFFHIEISTVGEDCFKDVMFTSITFSLSVVNPWSFHFARHPQLQIINVHTKLPSLRTRMFDGCANLFSIISDGEDILNEGQLNLVGINPESKLVAHVFRGVPIYIIELDLVSRYDSWFFEDLHQVETVIYHSALPADNFTIPESSSWFPRVHTISIGSYDIMIENVIDLSHVPVTSFGAYAFSDVEAWQIFLNSNSNQNSIPPYCFASCPYLESVYIPFPISTIPEGCFYNCTNLRSLNIRGYEFIEEGSLYVYNSQLKNFQAHCFSYVPFWRIVFGTSVTLSDRAFSNNEFLFEIELVTLLNTIKTDDPKSSPFRLTNLEFINIPRGSFCSDLPAFSPYFFLDTPLQTTANWQSISFCSVTCAESFTLAGFVVHPNCSYRLVKVQQPGSSVTIPDQIRYISQNVFDAVSATTVIFGAGVEQIDDFAFRGSKIENVVFHQNFTRLNYALFASCQTLVSVNFQGNVRALPAHCFYSCNNLQILKINGNDVLYQTEKYTVLDLENLTSVGRDAFFNVYFTDLKIPSAIENHGSIGIGQGIQTVQIYGFLTSFPITMFQSCTDLSLITINDEPVLQDGVLNLTSLYNINIGANAFAGVVIRTLIFSRAVTFHSEAFSGCPLENVIFTSPLPFRFSVPAQLRGLSSLVNLTMDSIPIVVNRVAIFDAFLYNYDAFAGLPIVSANVTGPFVGMFDQCNQLERVNFLFPFFTEIPDNTFRDCVKLTTIPGLLENNVLDTGVYTRIGTNSFFNVKIQSIQIRCFNIKIGDYAFAENTQLTTVNFINLTSRGFDIDEGAQIFYGCTSIQKVQIPTGSFCAFLEPPFADLFSGSNLADGKWSDYGCDPTGYNPTPRVTSSSGLPESAPPEGSAGNSNEDGLSSGTIAVIVIVVIVVVAVLAVGGFFLYRKSINSGPDGVVTTNLI